MLNALSYPKRTKDFLRIVRCFDLSATPFAPTGKTSTESSLFAWVISDFGLNDAIEAGLAKTPRVVIRDNALPNAQTYRSKLYHLYREPEVAEDLNRRGAQTHEALPQIVQETYTLLGADWRVAILEWQAAGHRSPPVMLTVCNRTRDGCPRRTLLSPRRRLLARTQGTGAHAARRLQGARQGRDRRSGG